MGTRRFEPLVWGEGKGREMRMRRKKCRRSVTKSRYAARKKEDQKKERQAYDVVTARVQQRCRGFVLGCKLTFGRLDRLDIDVGE
jgi:hypothetical protein